MSDARTQRIEEVFSDALEIESAAERAAFLQRACLNDPALLAAVEKKLAGYPAVESFFEKSRPAVSRDAEVVRLLAGSAGGVAAEFDSDGMVGSRIGPYQLLEIIGEGGCGTVYLARQENPVRRQVALKVIKLGMDTRNVIARFEAERQALAMMDHPNIARVLDAGATETGRPYFVMELVHGVKVTTYCDENHLETRPRLDLFIQICGAIQHAHQKGIVHRDIKPSNILVTMLDGKAVPKVIDFGIAKATGGERLTDNTLFTACEQFVGTPAYMSPEQAQMSGLDVDTRSDIYSLGVLLYELLTGRPPFEQAELLKSGLDEMRRTLLEREPHRPSTRLDALRADELTQTALQRHVEPLKLKSLLSGDLDWIVMKALEKDRNRRYQTANGLGMDVLRYLHNEPVFARPPSRLYRLQKLVRRNQAAFLAVAAVSLALIAGFGTSTWLFFKEREARREQARLRETAERARAAETRLRTEADARAKITQAALWLNRGQPVEADALVDKIQIPVTEPSLEAAGVFRTLGDWNIQQGRWEAAASRLLQMVRASQVDKSDMTDQATRDLLRVGPALVVAGQLDGYRRFVQDILVRFENTTNPVAAEQVIKVSLIVPADAATLGHLEPLGQVVERSIAQPPRSATEAYYHAWRALALTFLEYRRGDFTNAIVWGHKCLEYSDVTQSRIALARTLLAMSYARAGQPEYARSELAAGRALIERKIPEGLQKGVVSGSDTTGLWHDWVMAYILLHNEADNLVK